MGMEIERIQQRDIRNFRKEMTYVQEIHREITKSNLEGSRLSKYVHKLQECIQSACIMYTREFNESSKSTGEKEAQPKLNFDYHNFPKVSSEDQKKVSQDQQEAQQYSLRNDQQKVSEPSIQHEYQDDPHDTTFELVQVQTEQSQIQLQDEEIKQVLNDIINVIELCNEELCNVQS